MNISDQSHFFRPQPYSENAVPPAPIASIAHVSETDDWNPLVPRDSAWVPRGRRATHRANGKH